MSSVCNVYGLTDGNQILGEFPNMENSVINFKGKGNILFCESGVALRDSTLNFKNDNSLIFLGTCGHSSYSLNISTHNNTVFHLGAFCYTNNTVSVELSEHRHCFIGDYSIFSTGICFRNADAHLLYSCSTKKRLNPTKSIYVGDHVWIGMNSLILKGTQIDSGSIIGAGSIVSGKKIPHNTVWGGNPAKQLKDDIFWDERCVHSWTEDMTEISADYDAFLNKYPGNDPFDNWIFEYTKAESLDFDEIDQQLNARKTCQEMCDYLIQLNSKKAKNRFVHNL